MKRFVLILLSIISLAFTSVSFAQTCYYTYQYTITNDGMKTVDSRSKSIHKSFSIITFSNNKSYVATTDKNGVSKSNLGYRYQYSDNGFNIYLPGHSGTSNEVGNLANDFLASGMKAGYGYSIIGVSFSQNYDTMLVHQSDGSNQVYKKTSNPNQPQIRY